MTVPSSFDGWRGVRQDALIRINRVPGYDRLLVADEPGSPRDVAPDPKGVPWVRAACG